MGNWQLEIGKMVLYVTFPVAMFHYFNQPEMFEEWVVQMKRDIFPPENQKQQQEFREALKKVQKELAEKEKLS